ncbi:hypothetical protein ACL02O_11140 [Micromonospora sp. MS34]
MIRTSFRRPDPLRPAGLRRLVRPVALTALALLVIRLTDPAARRSEAR